MPFGPKKVEIFEANPFQWPSNGFARIKIIMASAIKTTGTLIVHKVLPIAGVVAAAVLAGVVMVAGVVN